MNVKLLFFILAFFGSALRVRAQELKDATSPNAFKRGLAGTSFYSQIGFSTFPATTLNERFSASNIGYSDISGSAFSIGAGGHTYFDNVLLGANADYLTTSGATGNPAFSTAISAFALMFNGGYTVYTKDNFSTYPLIGLGYSTSNLSINSNSVPQFDTVLAVPKNGSRLSTSTFQVQIGAGAEYVVALSNNVEEKSSTGILVGLRAMYSLPISYGDWTIGEKVITGGPNFSMSGFSIKMLIGFSTLRY